jgi:hypothetical protein
LGISSFKIENLKFRIGMTFKEHRKIFLLLVCFSLVASRDFSVGQEINERGWPLPDLRGLSPYSITIQEVNGAEKIVEKFFTPEGGHIARVSGNGKVFAYIVDMDQKPPIDYFLIDPNGSGRYTQKFGSKDSYSIPDWVLY